MIVVVDLRGTLVANQRLGYIECIAALEEIRAHRIVSSVRLWTGDNEVPREVLERVHEIRAKPDPPVDNVADWEDCLIIDDDELLLSMCERSGARTVHASRLDQVVGMLDDIIDGEA